MDPQNPLPSAELKRNRSAAVVISEQHYCHLQLQASWASKTEALALRWLLALPPSATPRSKAEIDAEQGADDLLVGW
jgi:hypothetical protein